MIEKILFTKHPIVTPMVKHRRMCLECNLCELTNYYGQDASLVFSESFDSKYDMTKGESIADRLIVKRLSDMYARYSIAFERKEAPEWEEYRKFLIQSILQGKLVVIHYDCYYADWDPYYRKTHNWHTVLVTGIRAGEFYVSDSYFAVKKWIPEEILKMASKRYYEIDVPALKRLPKHWHKEAFLKKYNEILKEYFTNMSVIERDLLQINCAEEQKREKVGDDVLPSEIIRCFDNLELNKHRFGLFLTEWEMQEGHNHYSIKYEDVLTYWRSFRVALFKARCKKYPEKYLENLSKQFKLILKQENKFLDEMDYGLVCLRKRSDAYFELIESYYNCKGLSMCEDDKEADCTGLDEFICVDGARERVERCGYYLSVESNMDNIVCDGQIIDFSAVRYLSKIILLISSEWGSYPIRFKVHYLDGTEDELRYTVRDWSIRDVHRMEMGRSYVRKEGKAQINQIEVYADELEINFFSDKQVQSLSLPNCPNIHIFSAKVELQGETNE